MTEPLEIARVVCREQDVAAWLVGGRLRDAFLGRLTLDTDIAVAGDARMLARVAARRCGGAFVDLHRAPDVARAVWSHEGMHVHLDVSALNGPSIEHDLRSRDYTANALASPLGAPLPPDRSSVIDPTGGLDDLDRRTLRMVDPAAFEADPLRLLRGPRLAAELDFSVDPATRAAIRRSAHLACAPAGERIRDELLRLLAAERPADRVRELDDLGLLAVLLPEVSACQGVRQSAPHVRDVYEHTLVVVEALEELERLVRGDAVPALHGTVWQAVLAPYAERLADGLAEPWGGAPRRAVLSRLAGLLHDVGKPTTASIEPDGRVRFLGHAERGAALAASVAERLRLSAQARSFVTGIVRHHQQPRALARAGVTRRAVYRFYRSAGDVGPYVALQGVADLLGKAHAGRDAQDAMAGVVRELLAAWFDEPARRVSPPALVRGDDVMRVLGIAPGREVGRLLAAIREAQAAGEVDTPDQALALARRLHTDVEDVPRT